MKKLLGILSAFSLTVSTPLLVVACGANDRITSPKLNQKLAKQLLVSISGNKDLANIDFGSMFSDSEIESVIVSMVNELLSLQYSFDSTNNIYDQLGFKEKYSSDKNGIEKDFKDKYNLDSRTAAENKLFEDYTKSFSGTKLDYWSVNNNYNLNIQKKATVNSVDDSGEVEVGPEEKYIYISNNTPSSKSDVWRFTNEMGRPTETEVENTNILPTLEQLTMEFQENSKSPFWVKSGEKMVRISSKTALYLRFQDYFEAKLLEEINENLLTSAYLKSTMFNMKQISGKQNKSPFINPSSTMFSKTQTLNAVSINEKWKTNVKMVWTLRFDVTKGNKISEINNIVKASDAIDPSTGALKEGRKLSDIYSIFNDNSKPQPIKDNKSGYDSYFGLNGYQGLTIYSGDTAIGESPISGKTYESNIKKWNNTAGIVKNNPADFLTVDSEDKNYADLVIVLPIYMIELLGGSFVKKQQQTYTGEVKDPTYTIKGKKTNDNKQEKSEIQFSSTIGKTDQYKERWNNTYNKVLHSADVAELATDSIKQEALLNQIMYTLSKDSSSSDLAKTVIYTKYLDKDQVYYAGLWDKIGTYIKSEDDKDE